MSLLGWKTHDASLMHAVPTEGHYVAYEGAGPKTIQHFEPDAAF